VRQQIDVPPPSAHYNPHPAQAATVMAVNWPHRRAIIRRCISSSDTSVETVYVCLYDNSIFYHVIYALVDSVEIKARKTQACFIQKCAFPLGDLGPYLTHGALGRASLLQTTNRLLDSGSLERLD